MITIPDEMVKKGCSILTILEDGSSCLYKYPPGYLLSASVRPLNHRDRATIEHATCVAVRSHGWFDVGEAEGGKYYSESKFNQYHILL